MYQIDRRDSYSDKSSDSNNSYLDVISWFIIIAVIWGLVSAGKSNNAAEKPIKMDMRKDTGQGTTILMMILIMGRDMMIAIMRWIGLIAMNMDIMIGKYKCRNRTGQDM